MSWLFWPKEPEVTNGHATQSRIFVQVGDALRVDTIGANALSGDATTVFGAGIGKQFCAHSNDWSSEGESKTSSILKLFALPP